MELVRSFMLKRYTESLSFVSFNISYLAKRKYSIDMDLAKLHPFSIENLTSPDKNVESCRRLPVASNYCVQQQHVPPTQQIPAATNPVRSFQPNFLLTDAAKANVTSLKTCTQNLYQMDNSGHMMIHPMTYRSDFAPAGRTAHKTVSACRYAMPEVDSNTSPSSKRRRVNPVSDLSPVSTDSGFSRCRSPAGASDDSTGPASRSSSPIDVLSFDGNDSILAPVSAAKQMNRTEKVGKKSRSAATHENQTGRSMTQQLILPSEIRPPVKVVSSEIGQPVKMTNSRKRQRDGELKEKLMTETKNVAGEPITEDGKPVYSYLALISKAILSHPDKKMVLSDIYQYVMENFPYYNNDEKAWRNSIRHNLSLNECFVKVGRSENGKGNYWSIHPSCIDDFAKGDYRRRQARRRARTVVNPVELRQTVSIQGFSVPQAAMYAQMGPRSAPPTVHPVLPPFNPPHPPSHPISVAGSAPNTIGYVPMTSSAVRDNHFYPYFSTIPNFNFFQPCTPSLIPTLPPLPALYPNQSESFEIKSGKETQGRQPKPTSTRLAATKDRTSKETASPEVSPDRILSSVAPTLQDLLPTISCPIPPLPVHIPSHVVVIIQ